MIRSSQVLYINSKQRTSGTDDNFNITLPIQPGNKFNHVSVLNLSIPKSFYAVQEAQNTFIIREVYNNPPNTIDYLITVPVGNYTITSFITVMKGVLLAEGLINYNVIQENTRIEPQTGKLMFTHDESEEHDAVFVFQDNNIAELMGFQRNSENKFSAPVNGIEYLQSTSIVNFQSESQIYLHSDICLSHNDDILLSVFGTGNPYLSNIIFDNQDLEAYSKPILRRDSNNFHFYITNEFNNPILLNGVDLLMTIIVYEKLNMFDLFKFYIDYRISNDTEQKKIKEKVTS